MGYPRRNSCSKKTIKLANKKRVNLIVSVKKNQKNLVSELIDSFGYFNTKSTVVNSYEKSCPIEKLYQVLPINKNTITMKENLSWLSIIKTAILVTRKNFVKNTEERQLYVSNKTITAKKASQLIAGHWNVENRLHQNLDRSLQEDKDKSYKKPVIKSILRNICLNIFHKNKIKDFTLQVYKNTCNTVMSSN